MSESGALDARPPGDPVVPGSTAEEESGVQEVGGSVGVDETRGGSGGSSSGSPSRSRLVFRGILPLILLGLFLVGFLRWGPVGVFRAAFPPVEELTVERIAFPEEGLIRVQVVNGGPEPVTLSQVQVDEAYWDFQMDGEATIDRLERRTVDIPYPWVDGEPHEIALVTSTGLTFVEEVAVATRSPSPDARYLTTFALLGVYVGVIPVFIGLLWFPFLAGVGRRWIDFFLSVTMGLLLFLGADALAEALEMTERVASAFQGVGLVVLGLVGTPLLIEGLGRLRESSDRGGGHQAMRVAFLVALGIGLHNLGEGLAVGTAYASGEIALGTTLVLGFLLHNTTEGLGIVAPLARERPGIGYLVLLGAVAGVPTILGAWIGGFSYSPIATVFFLAVGAGAVAQVVWALYKMLGRREDGGLTAPLNAGGLLAGLAVMYLTGMLVAV
ncbi:MAG: ZIP family metal transporter [Longimicrobiales bacterium]|nr:ZIP family metal transporter [Longimicrobiales bacterium]